MRGRLMQLFRTGFFHIFGGNVINKVLTFLSSMIMVRILTKQEYGIFTYSWNIYNILLLFSGLGIVSGMLQMCSEQGGEESYTNTMLGYCIRMGTVCNLFLGAVLFLIARFAPLTVNGASDLLDMLLFLPVVQLVYELMSVYLRARKRNQEYVRLSVINTFFVLVISVCCAWYFKEKGLIVGYYAAYLFTVFYGVFLLRIPILTNDRRIERQEKIAMMKISVISMCNNGLAQLLYLLDVFVIGIVVADEAILASYKVGVIVPSALTFIPGALVTYLYPYFAERRKDRLWCLQWYKKIMTYFGIFNLFLSVTLVLLAPWIVPLFFGKQYADSILIFRILSINYFFSATFRIVSGNLLVAQRKLKFNLLVAAISGTVNVLADVVLISIYGSIGAAFATVIVTLVSGILSTAYLIYTLKSKSA